MVSVEQEQHKTKTMQRKHENELFKLTTVSMMCIFPMSSRAPRNLGNAQQFRLRYLFYFTNDETSV